MSNALALVIRVIVVAVSLWVATLIVPGIDNTAGTTTSRIGTLIGVALIFGLVNAVLKPLIKVVGCPFYVLTLGLIGLVVNALLFMLAGAIAGGLGLPFQVAGFGAAFLGAIVVGVVSFLLHILIPDRLDQRETGQVSLRYPASQNIHSYVAVRWKCWRTSARSESEIVSPTRSVSSSTESTTAWNASPPYVAIQRA